MLKLIFLFSISVAQAADIVSLTHKNDECVKTVQDFLSAKDTHPRIMMWKQLASLECGGLTYIDEVLKILVAQRFIWSGPQDKGPLLLSTLPLAISRTDVLNAGFFVSDLRSSIHHSAQKLLQKFEKFKTYRAPLLNLYRRLKLWDETDMPDVMAEYFVNQEMSGLLIEMVSSGSIETKIEFARRVHVRFTRRDLVDLTLLYRIQQLSDEQIPYLLQLLMQDADYRKQNNPDEYVYGENWLPVQTLRLEVLRSLSERLINLDPVVVAAYYELYNSLNESQGVRKDAQTAEYRKFLLRLKSGFFPDQCESKLQIVF